MPVCDDPTPQAPSNDGAAKVELVPEPPYDESEGSPRASRAGAAKMGNAQDPARQSLRSTYSIDVVKPASSQVTGNEKAAAKFCTTVEPFGHRPILILPRQPRGFLDLSIWIWRERH